MNALNISISENECWICGSNENITRHHVLPQHLKPNKNVIVPICKTCHDTRLNAEDVAGLFAHAHRMEQVMRSAVSELGALKRNVENLTMSRVKGLGGKQK